MACGTPWQAVIAALVQQHDAAVLARDQAEKKLQSLQRDVASMEAKVRSISLDSLASVTVLMMSPARRCSLGGTWSSATQKWQIFVVSLKLLARNRRVLKLAGKKLLLQRLHVGWRRKGQQKSQSVSWRR